MEIKYYDINEKAARQAMGMWSFSEYKEGSETADYKKQVNEVYALGEAAILRGVDAEKVQYYCDRFAKQYAEYKNKGFSIELQCPSVMISGASNFPVRKKEKQNAARQRHFETFDKMMSIKDRLPRMTAIAPKENAEPNKETTTEYFTVVENTDEDRLQLIFDGKPSEEVRTALKSNGYKWSPRFTAWQRQLTDNARRSVKAIEKTCAECK